MNTRKTITEALEYHKELSHLKIYLGKRDIYLIPRCKYYYYFYFFIVDIFC